MPSRRPPGDDAPAALPGRRVPCWMRDRDGHGRAAAGRTLDLERPLHQSRSLLHARVAKAPTEPRLRWVESDSVVGHRHSHATVAGRHRETDPARAGMSGHVSQRLLSDAEETDRDLGRELRGRFERRQLRGNRLPPGELRALPARRPASASERSGPPTIPPPSCVSNNPKMGALETR